jgi:hypothetical protein
MPLVRSTAATTSSDSYSTFQPLKYGGNANRESMYPMLIDDTTVTADSRGIKTVKAGTLMVAKTDGSGYGPYASGASDGRQTLGTAPNCLICSADVNLTVDPVAGVHKPVEIGGYGAYVDFNFSQLTVNGATISAVRTAFPLCVVHAS